MPGIKNPADQYATLLESRSVLDAIVEQFGLKDIYDTRHMDTARRTLEGRTAVTVGVKDGMISIEVEDGDPKRAADMANAFVEELRNLTKSLAIGEAAQRRLFFEQQLHQSRDNLTKAEIALQASGMSEAALRTMPQSALESLARLKAQITTQEIKLASMRTFMTDANPEFRLAVGELAALREELSKAERRNPTKSPNDGAEYITKYRDFKYHETLFELMAKQYELARLDEAREGAVIQVVDAAETPSTHSKPNRPMIAVLTALIAFFLILLAVVLRHSLIRAESSPRTAHKAKRLRDLMRLSWR